MSAKEVKEKPLDPYEAPLNISDSLLSKSEEKTDKYVKTHFNDPNRNWGRQRVKNLEPYQHLCLIKKRSESI